MAKTNGLKRGPRSAAKALGVRVAPRTIELNGRRPMGMRPLDMAQAMESVATRFVFADRVQITALTYGGSR